MRTALLFLLTTAAVSSVPHIGKVHHLPIAGCEPTPPSCDDDTKPTPLPTKKPDDGCDVTTPKPKPTKKSDDDCDTTLPVTPKPTSVSTTPKDGCDDVTSKPTPTKPDDGCDDTTSKPKSTKKPDDGCDNSTPQPKPTKKPNDGCDHTTPQPTPTKKADDATKSKPKRSPEESFAGAIAKANDNGTFADAFGYAKKMMEE